mgnify:CR=1 FL=1
MSKIEVDAIDKQSGSTLTLGGSGTAVTLACGATQTGFGRTGAVDWQTASIKTATFTAANGEGYFCNTSGGAFTVNLPAGSAGAIVSIQDYNNTFDSNSLTVDPNGSEKINGGIAGGFVTLSTEGLGITFVYIDATVGWRSVDSNEYSTSGATPTFTCASVSGSGNAITTASCGNYKIATFTGPGNFTVNSVGNPSGGGDTVEYIIVAGGGGGGGQYIAGGGGAGGFRFASPSLAPLTYPGKPLAAPAGITVTAQVYPISVGGGGTGNASSGNTDSTRGISTTALGLTATGGGAGKQDQGPGNNTGQPGGSGGGGSGGAPGDAPTAYLKGSGNTPPVSPSQGNDGGNGGAPGSPAPGSGPGSPYVAGGGGGAMAVGGCGTRPNSTGGPGGVGAGVPNAFGTSGQSSGGYYYFAGGGGGNASTCGPAAGPATSGSGGLGGGGAGQPNAAGTAGTANTGGGGGGTDSRGSTNAGGNGGSGIVIIRYKFQ